MGYGASKQDWCHLDLVLGLGEDLLPVVSNPKAKISKQSKMKQLGKVPSQYNGGGNVSGFLGWTQYRATGGDIDKWSAQEDYGICLQTREVRALDIDVEDGKLVNRILSVFCDSLFPEIPVRFRKNNAKCLLAFRVEGELNKRVMKVKDNAIIEFLADGQQFIAHGTHPSGARYEWEMNDCDDFPTISLEEFEKLWAALVDKFAIEEVVERGSRKRGDDLNLEDDIVDFLDNKGLVLGSGADGQLYITCPFEEEHTTDTGEAATCYFPAGSGGYEQGHFKCLHAHCEGRTDGAFIEALGVRAADFEALPVALPIEESKEQIQELPRFKRVTKTGEIHATITNLRMAIERPDVCKLHIAKDVFREELVLARWSEVGKRGAWRVVKDTDYTKLRDYLEQESFKPISSAMIREVVHMVAGDNEFDSAIEWLEGVTWDGVGRVSSFAEKYLGVEAGAYSCAVSEYMWSAMAGRVLSPGCKADMVPILCSNQGVRKSTGIEALSPAPELFVLVALGGDEDNRIRKNKGKLIGEIGELRGMHSSALESVKAFVTQTHDNWVPKYMESAVTYARRIFFIGTTNHKEILTDTTGNRRWLPLEVTQVDKAAIERDRDKLWAEGAEIFKERGVVYEAAETLGLLEHDDYRIVDPWEDIIRDWLIDDSDMVDDHPMDKGYLTTQEVLHCAVGMKNERAHSGYGKRVCEILRALGYENRKRRVGGLTVRGWAKK